MVCSLLSPSTCAMKPVATGIFSRTLRRECSSPRYRRRTPASPRARRRRQNIAAPSSGRGSRPAPSDADARRFRRPRRSVHDGTRFGPIATSLATTPPRSGRQRGIVIARYPDPVAPCLQRRDRVAVRRRQPVMGVAVVKTVAERNHHARIVPRDHRRKPAERRHRIVGRQQHAARRKARALFQMQVGDHQQALLFPEQRAGEIGDQGDAGDITDECSRC